MKRLHCLGMLVVLAAVAVAGGMRFVSAMAATELKPSDPAPPFSLRGSDGRTYNLADFKGKQAVVLAWFVKAYSGG